MEKQKQSNASEASLMMNAKALAAMLGISLRQVWRLNSTGKLPKPVRLGGSVRWRRDEIIAWLGQNCPDRAEWEAIKESGQRKQ